MIKKEIKMKNKGNNTVCVAYHTTHNAITLIALIITIILLLILAGVTLSLTIGKGGILNESKQATDEHIKQEATETMNLKITAIQMKSYTETQQLPNLQYLADNLCEDNDMEYVIKKETEVASLDKIDVSGVNSIFTKIKKYPYEFEIDSSLRLSSINGVKLAENDNSNLLERLETMEASIKELQDENNMLKSSSEEQKNSIAELNNKVNLLGVNKRIILATPAATVFNLTDTWLDCSADINLSDSIRNYRYLEFQFDVKWKQGGTFGTEKTQFVSTEQISISSTTIKTDSYIELTVGSGTALMGYFTSEKKLHISGTINSATSSYSQIRIRNIYGIK